MAAVHRQRAGCQWPPLMDGGAEVGQSDGRIREEGQEGTIPGYRKKMHFNRTLCPMSHLCIYINRVNQ